MALQSATFGYIGSPFDAISYSPTIGFGDGVAWAAGNAYANILRVPRACTVVGVEFAHANVASPGSGFQVGLQAVSTVTGAPAVPATGQWMGGASNFVTYTPNIGTSWNAPGLLPTPVALTPNQLVAVVRIAPATPGTVYATAISVGTNFPGVGSPYRGVLASGAASWAAYIPYSYDCVALLLDDGTYLSVPFLYPVAATSLFTFSTTHGAAISGLSFTLPIAAKCSGAWIGRPGAWGGDAEICLIGPSGSYAGRLASTILQQNAVLNSTTAGNSTVPVSWPNGPVTLLPGLNYKLVVRPTSSGNVSHYIYACPSAAHVAALIGLPNWALAQSTIAQPAGLSDWTITPASVPPNFRPIVSALSDDVTGPGTNNMMFMSG